MMKGIILLALLFPLPSSAFIFMDPVNLVQNTISATNSVTSLMNQVRSIRSQLQAYQYNFMHLGQFHYQDIGHAIRQLDVITRQGQSISYAMQDIDAQFKRDYPDYSRQTAVMNYEQAYHNWNQTSMNTFRNSLHAIGSNTASVQQEDQLMQQLKTQSQQAQGRTQVLQVANELSVESIRELESLKHLIGAQSNAQTAYMAQQVSQYSFQQHSLDELMKHLPDQFPSYSVSHAFGKIR